MRPTRNLAADIRHSHDLQDFFMPARFYDWWHDVHKNREVFVDVNIGYTDVSSAVDDVGECRDRGCLDWREGCMH